MSKAGEDHEAAVGGFEHVDERGRHELTVAIDEIELERRRRPEGCSRPVVFFGAGSAKEAEREQRCTPWCMTAYRTPTLPIEIDVDA
jgi:hypothetical protein